MRTLLLATLLATLLACDRPSVGPYEGRLAPEIGALDLEGHAVTVDALSGKPTVVVFWASWCGPCRKETPEVAALHADYGDRVHVVGVNAGEQATKAKTASTQLGMTWPVVLDPDGAVQRRYQVSAIPLVVVLDAQGLVRYRGHALPTDIHRLLDGLLG